ncbi:MAG: NAD+ synthase [Nitrospirae bacterium]|nr:MAG: NAD+ synthase [Nitrospirota bacterium]
MTFLRLALAQMNPVVGDLSGNAGRIIRTLKKAVKEQADIVVFPELALTGYPPEDLILKPQFIADNMAEMKRISSHAPGITAIIGFVDAGEKGGLYNAAAVISGGKLIDIYHKILLPNYGVFDEVRYFKPGKRVPVYSIPATRPAVRFGINICEDIWHAAGPARQQSLAGAELIININASPYETGKPECRRRLIQQRAAENSVVIAYLNTVGGQDELVFDGLSMVYDHTGCLIAQAKAFAEELMIVDLDLGKTRKYRRLRGLCDKPRVAKTAPALQEIRVPAARVPARHTMRKAGFSGILIQEEEIYRALMLGTADYIRKNGFKGAVIGLSGGIDSSLVAAVAADAIGRENVTGVFMPSEFTSQESREDAFLLAENLGITITELPIGKLLQEYKRSLVHQFEGLAEDITEENLQARIRGNLLMALSNKFGWIVLTTGNKSEMSVGYATLYGDMAGGFAVIKDVPKTLVYRVCRWRNLQREGGVIPARVLVKEPTAELRPDQKDSDSLPPYEILDPILKAYIEEEISFEEIVRLGYDAATVKRVISLVDRSEYKRRQSPPGIKITGRAFGRDRRFPITNRYRSY